MLIHNDLFSVVLGACAIISNPKKGTEEVSYKMKNSHTHYLCPLLSAVFIRTTLLGRTVQSNRNTALEAIKAGDWLKIKTFKKHIRYWIPAFKLSGFSFWKKGMRLCVCVSMCLLFKVNEYHRRRIHYYFITSSEYYSDRLYWIDIDMNTVLWLGLIYKKVSPVDGLVRSLNVWQLLLEIG